MTAEELKASVLQMAIEGRLVPQCDDEPAVDIDGEELEDVPFAIPDKWKWVRLGEIFIFVDYRGTTPVKSSSGIRLMTASNVRKGYIDHSRVEFISEEEYLNRQSRGISAKGDILFTTEAPLGNAAIADLDIYSAGQRVITLKSDIVNKILYMYFLLSPYFQRLLIENATGTTAQGIKASRLKNLFIPLPPIEEQRRIVEKLEEMLPVIEQYGKAHDALQVMEKELPGKLRASLLQEAISGRLVPQRDDEPAVDIDVEEPDDVPFAIPDRWKWVKVRDVGRIASGATPKTGIAEFWSPEEIPWITPADLGKNRAKTIGRGERFISRKGYESCSAVLLPKGTIIYSSRAPIGYIAIAENEVATNQGCKSVVPNLDVVEIEYVYYTLIALTKDIISRASGTTFLEISGKKMGETLFPLPQLAEQRRIVERLNELLPSVEAMEKLYQQ